MSRFRHIGHADRPTRTSPIGIFVRLFAIIRSRFSRSRWCRTAQGSTPVSAAMACRSAGRPLCTAGWDASKHRNCHDLQRDWILKMGRNLGRVGRGLIVLFQSGNLLRFLAHICRDGIAPIDDSARNIEIDASRSTNTILNQAVIVIVIIIG